MEDVEIGDLQYGEFMVKHKATGLNFLLFYAIVDLNNTSLTFYFNMKVRKVTIIMLFLLIFSVNDRAKPHSR